MSKDKQEESQDSGFDLGAPSGKIKSRSEQPAETERKFDAPPGSKKTDPRVASDAAAGREWKGFEAVEEYEPEVDFGHTGVTEDELDMTPMVDVTFLLLIFFMVTASFTLQKSIQQPPVSTEDPSNNVREDQQDEDQYVEVIIDQFNTYRLTSKDSEELEAPSDQEMRVRLRDMVSSTNAKKLIITAHGDAYNEKVVTAWDAGNDNNLEEIVIRLSEEDF